MEPARGTHKPRPAGRQRWLAVALAIALTSCASQPTTEPWTRKWEALTAGIPPLQEVLSADASARSALCSEAVGHLRSAAAEIEQAPDPDIRHAAIAYLEFTESVFFECPPTQGEYAGFEAGYAELHRLAAVVDTLIGFDD